MVKFLFFCFLLTVGIIFDSFSAEDTIHPFVEKYCKDAVAFETALDVQQFGIESVTLQGLYIELGVCGGGSIQHIASLVPFQFIYGFDSFEGLPEAWDKGDVYTPKGSWALDELPYVHPNVRLIVGWFEDTLPEFVKMIGTDEPIAFLHVDCDIYSSTACGLTTFAPLIQEGTIIVFDELYRYPNYENHEWKALNEFLEAYSFRAEFIAYNKIHEQVAIRIHRR